MIKKFLAKLVGWREQRTDFGDSYKRQEEDNRRLAEERHQMTMESRGNRKYVSERTVPTEGQIEAPVNSGGDQTEKDK